VRDATRLAERTLGPLLELFIRLWLAGIFWASGMVKLQSWNIALYLSAHEYPVSWMDPVTAAWIGESIEIVCPPLLVFGLATRFAAVPMLLLSLVIQFSYQALDQHLFWAMLFGWFVVKGAGPISLDALIGRGIAATALPLEETIARVFRALSQWGDPAFKLLLRCRIAALFFQSGVMKISNFDMTQMLFHAQSAQALLPPELAARLTILVELGCLIWSLERGRGSLRSSS
jgi:NADH dehydrogenase/putative oxidoreductase